MAGTSLAEIRFGAWDVFPDDAYVAARSHAVSAQLVREQTKQAGIQRYKAWSALSPRVSVGGRSLRLSNLDKELYPDVAKASVVDYYAREVGEQYRDGTPVIMNLSEMDDSDAKRLVDFAAGLIFATRGSIERVTNKVFLLSPPNVTVAAADKQRIAEGGFFNQS